MTQVHSASDDRTANNAVRHTYRVLSDAEKAQTQEGLKSLAGHLRSRLGKSLRLRLAPELEFVMDESIAHAARIETLLAQIKDGTLAPPDASDLD